jgi:integrase
VLEQLLHERQRPQWPERPLLASISGTALSAPTLGRAVRELTDRAGVQVDAPSHAFRRTVATLMYEAGVRSRVIERIMGWAPRTMHERHYLRVCDQPMREAIETLYRDDPICEQRPATPTPRPAAQSPPAWLADETARLIELEHHLGLNGSGR